MIRNQSAPPIRSQSGIVLFVTLIALVIVLVGALALIRSSDTTSVISGNIAFKRDMTNNAEIGVAKALSYFGTGGLLATAAATNSSNTAANYSAVQLTTSAANRGIPDALINDSLFTGTAADIDPDGLGVTKIRYLIDRMCTVEGASPTPTTCVLSTSNSDKGGTSWLRKAGGSSLPVYRISIRVSGPRNTLAFVQSTVVVSN